MKRYCLNCGSMNMQEHRMLHDGWKCNCGFVVEIEDGVYSGYKRSENDGKLGHWVDVDEGCLLILKDEEL